MPSPGLRNSEPQKTDSALTRCFRELLQTHDEIGIYYGRLVEDSGLVTFFISALSPEKLEALFESQEFKDCFAALRLAQPPVLFRADRLIWSFALNMKRVTFATLSFPYPATEEQRHKFGNTGCLPIPNLFHEEAPRSGRTLTPRAWKVWIPGPHRLPDGREVEIGLIYQPWRKPEHEDAAAGEEWEKRERWMGAVLRGIGLADISVQRYNMYHL